MPYSTSVGLYQGHRTIHILIDGQEWQGPWDAVFAFGNHKCRMILETKAIIEKFYSDGINNVDLITKTIPPGNWMPNRIEIAVHDRFQPLAGVIIEDPYIHLKCSLCEIGFGLRKAGALLGVWGDLTSFAAGEEIPPMITLGTFQGSFA